MLKVRQIKINFFDDETTLINKICKTLKIDKSEIVDYKIVKESIDCRKKPDIYKVYEVNIKLENENKILKYNKSKDILQVTEEKYLPKITGINKLKNKPVIIGSGPAGLFAAYMLSEYGYKPIIIEQGDNVDDRIIKVEEFWNNNILDINSNVQFGEGGAGTFSDGKLNTLVKDKENRCKKVFEIFIENGAPNDIMYKSLPHIGTNILRTVVKNMRNKIIDNGGEFRFNSKLTNLVIENKRIRKVIINNKEELNTDILILAIGHSSRDTFEMLYNNNIHIESKPFAIGVRIVHPQEIINIYQYGNNYVKEMPQASYKVTHKCSNGRGVYSFCMCPGGFVVNASSEKERLVVNGMSNRERNEPCANSAIIVTVNEKDYGKNPLDGIKYQRLLEEKAYIEGKGLIPLQLYKDFKNNRISTSLGCFNPSIKGKYNFANLNNILPNFMVESIIEGIEAFSKQIKGFNMDDACLLGIETRTSSPVRIKRNENLESNIKGIYPIGEGSGYSGGITTSAIEGLKVFEELIKEFK